METLFSTAAVVLRTPLIEELGDDMVVATALRFVFITLATNVCHIPP